MAMKSEDTQNVRANSRLNLNGYTVVLDHTDDTIEVTTIGDKGQVILAPDHKLPHVLFLLLCSHPQRPNPDTDKAKNLLLKRLRKIALDCTCSYDATNTCGGLREALMFDYPNLSNGPTTTYPWMGQNVFATDVLVFATDEIKEDRDLSFQIRTLTTDRIEVFKKVIIASTLWQEFLVLDHLCGRYDYTQLQSHLYVVVAKICQQLEQSILVNLRTMFFAGSPPRAVDEKQKVDEPRDIEEFSFHDATSMCKKLYHQGVHFWAEVLVNEGKNKKVVLHETITSALNRSRPETNDGAKMLNFGRSTVGFCRSEVHGLEVWVALDSTTKKLYVRKTLSGCLELFTKHAQ